MKKLLSVFAAVGMLFGFASCSGDLHDDVKIDPNAMKGNWSYRVIDTADDDSINMITNNAGGQSGAYGSPDFTVDVSNSDVKINDEVKIDMSPILVSSKIRREYK